MVSGVFTMLFKSIIDVLQCRFYIRNVFCYHVPYCSWHYPVVVVYQYMTPALNKFPRNLLVCLLEFCS